LDLFTHLPVDDTLRKEKIAILVITFRVRKFIDLEFNDYVNNNSSGGYQMVDRRQKPLQRQLWKSNDVVFPDE
jgi:hypothetical protein